ncbi:MAG: TolC family protein [Leptospirillia bacterium]
MFKGPLKTVAYAMFGVFLWVPSGHGEVLGLDVAVRAALADNPSLEVVAARAQAMAEIPTQAGALPDPALTLGAMNLPSDSFATGREPMTQLQVGIRQKLPFPGKRRLKNTTAQHAADAALADLEEAHLTLVRDVVITWWHLFYMDQAIEIVGRNQDLLRQFVSIARTRYRVGKGLQQDVLLAEVELSKLLDRALELEGMRTATAAQLNALLGRPGKNPITLPREADEELPDVASDDVLFARALTHRPMLSAATSRGYSAVSALELAGKEHLPDFMVSATYGFRDGENMDGSERADFASLMLSVDLPLYKADRQDRQVAQRTHELAEQSAALRQATDRLQADLIGLRAKYMASRERVRLFRAGIIPQASQTVSSMLAGYQVNKVDFLNLVRSQITLYNYETLYWKGLSEAKGDRARLIAAAGGGVDPEEAMTSAPKSAAPPLPSDKTTPMRSEAHTP